MRLPLRLAAVLALVSSVVSVSSIRADVLPATQLFSDEGIGLVGFDKGAYSFEVYGGCRVDATTYYQTCFLNSNSHDITKQSVATLDVGAPCSIALLGFTSIQREICNNGYLAVIATTASSPYDFVFANGDPNLRFTQSNAADLLYLDSQGDVIYNNPQSELWYEALDVASTQTPEPSGIALLSTGLLGIGAAARRRFC